jgi:hypothetical protein
MRVFSKGRSETSKIATHRSNPQHSEQRIKIFVMEVRELAAQVSSRHQYLGWQGCDGELKT